MPGPSPYEAGAWVILALLHPRGCVLKSPLMQNLRRTIILVALLAVVSLPASAQGPAPVATWQVLVNKARLDEGLAPYGFSTLLVTAAQRHADDLAAHQIWSHTGSDGSTPRQRVAEAGYAAWTWNSGELIVGENFWTGYGSIEDALAFFLEDPPHRDNLLSTTYREIGIGVAADTANRNYYVLDFGVRPNVLPIFINDGATNAEDSHVAIRLTNEEARPQGQGAIFVGRAIEIRVSNEPDFDDRPWQRWEPLVPWTLPDTPGEHTVYVQFRDAAGRTAASADAIVLGEGAPGAPTPVPPSPTAEPTVTPMLPSPTSELTATPEPMAPPVSEPAATLTPEVIPTPEPSPSVEPTPTPDVARPASVAPGNSTPFPTWTPLPTAVPQEEVSRPGIPWAALVALQGTALILGLCLVLRRGNAIRNA